MRIFPSSQFSTLRLSWATLSNALLLCVALFWLSPQAALSQEQKAEAPVPAPAQKVAVEKKAEAENADEKKAEEKKADGVAEEKADEKKEEAKPAAKPNPPNLIQGIINNIFGGKQPKPQPPNAKPAVQQDDAQPADPGDNSEKLGAVTLDAVDRRAPVDRAQTTILERAERAAEIGNWSQVVGQLDCLFERNQDSLVLRGDGTMVSIRHEAIRILGAMPAEQREIYVRQYSAAAKNLLDEAKAEDNVGKLVEVATRYFWTDSGTAAADLLGTLHLDRGEYGMASVWLKLLLDANSSVTQTPGWQAKAYFVFKMAGKLDLASAIENQFSKPTIEDSLLVNSVLSRQPVELDEWLFLFGNVRRHSVSTGSEPVLLKRWELQTTWNQPLIKKIDQLITEFADRGVPTIPVGMPLLVDGYLVARTFQGVQVADAKTGREIWATEFDKSIEGSLTGANVDPQFAVFNQNPQVFFQNSNAGDSTGGPLGRIMFQNAANSLLSSDGKRVYIVEDTPLFTMGQSNVFGFNRSANKNAFASNRLKAYDLKTGRPLWEAGGEESIEELALPLRGCFFLGAPVPDGDDLLVVAEQDGEIHLHVLEPATGHPKWSQLLAYPEVRINKDYRRRIWSTQVSVAGGTVICPTSVGWMVAVDRTRRSVLWAFRYSERSKPTEKGARQFGGAYMYVQNEPLNSRWATSAPIIVGDRILYTPPERSNDDGNPNSVNGIDSGTLACVDLYSGKHIWQKPRAQYLYLAGAVEDKFFLVSPDGVEAFSMENKKALWTAKFEPADGKPSGRGVILNGHFYQPMQQNQLLKVNLADGKVVSRLELSDNERPLGNLSMYDGTVVSFHPAAITAFEQQHAIDAKLAKIRAGANDDESVIFEAEVALAQGEFQRTIDLLVPLYQAENKARDRRIQERIEDSLRRASVAKLRLSPGDQPDLVAILHELVRTPRHELDNRQLRIAALIAGAQYADALAILIGFCEQPESQTLTRLDQPKVETEFDNWLAGQMADTWAQLDVAQQAQVSSAITGRFEALVAAKDTNSQRRFARLFEFHPAVTTLFHSLAESAITEKDAASAAHWLQMLQARSTVAERTLLIQRELELAISTGDWLAANQLLQRVEADAASGINLDEKRRLVSDLQPKAPPDWGDFDLAMSRSASNYSYRTIGVLEGSGTRHSFLNDLRLEYGQQGYSQNGTERINFVRESDDSLYWSVPIRSGRSLRTIFEMQVSDRQVIVLNRGIINCLSIPDRRVLWTAHVGDTDLEIAQNAQTAQRLEPMQTADAFLASGSHQHEHLNGAIPIFNNEFLCFRGRREIVCIDAHTGQTRWTCERIVAGTRVFASESTVFIVPANQNEAFALRASDGKEIKNHPAISLFDQNVVDNSGNRVVRCTRTGMGAEANITLTAIEPETQRVLWRQDFALNSFFKKLADDEIAVFNSAGVTSLLDLNSGKLQTLEAIPADKRAGSNPPFMIACENFVLTIFNSGGNSYSYYGEMPFMHASGNLVALDTKTGKIAWIKAVDKLNLMLAQIRRSPVLVFTHQEYDQKLQTQRLSVVALDKKTGRELVNSATYSFSSFRSISIDLQGRFIDVSTYNERMRLDVVARKPDEPKSEKPAATTATDTKADANINTTVEPKVEPKGEQKVEQKVEPKAEQKVAPKAEAIKAVGAIRAAAGR